MIRNDQEIEWAGELHRLSVCGHHLLAPCKPERLLRPESDAEAPRVEGEVGMDMGVAPKDALRIADVQIG